jgi:hypothetical protein
VPAPSKPAMTKKRMRARRPSGAKGIIILDIKFRGFRLSMIEFTISYKGGFSSELIMFTVTDCKPAKQIFLRKNP